MNRIEEMIKRLCPKGVESVKLGDYIVLYTGEQLNKANMFKIGSYPVINGGVSASGFVEAYNVNKQIQLQFLKEVHPLVM